MLQPTAARRVRSISERALALALFVAGGCAAAPAPAPSSSGGEVAQRVCSAASFEDLARRLRDHYCLTVEGSIGMSEIESCDDVQVTLQVPARGGALDARLLELATPTGRVFVLMACASDHLEAFFLEDLWNDTDEGETASTEGLVRRFDLAPRGAIELRLDIVFLQAREAHSGCAHEWHRDERAILCTAAPTGPRCVDVPTLRSGRAECDELCLNQMLAEEEPTCQSEGARTYDAASRLALDLEGDRVRVSRMPLSDSSTEELEAPAGLVGEHSFEELLAIRPLESIDLTMLPD